VNESVVEDWVNTGGRPLGLAFDGNGQLIVADADKVTGFHINVGFEYVFSAYGKSTKFFLFLRKKG